MKETGIPILPNAFIKKSFTLPDSGDGSGFKFSDVPSCFSPKHGWISTCCDDLSLFQKMFKFVAPLPYPGDGFLFFLQLIFKGTLMNTIEINRLILIDTVLDCLAVNSFALHLSKEKHNFLQEKSQNSKIVPGLFRALCILQQPSSYGDPQHLP